MILHPKDGEESNYFSPTSSCLQKRLKKWKYLSWERMGMRPVTAVTADEGSPHRSDAKLKQLDAHRY